MFSVYHRGSCKLYNFDLHLYLFTLVIIVVYSFGTTNMASRLVIGDSIAQNLRHLNDTDIWSFRGASVNDIINCISFINVSDYSCIVLLCGTNNIISDDLKGILASFHTLVQKLMFLNPLALIIISSVLPRPIDDTLVGHKVILVNYLLKKYSLDWGAHFIPSFKLFLSHGHIVKQLYHTDLLHLSLNGTIRLRQYFLQRFSGFGFKSLSFTTGITNVLSRKQWAN